MQIFTCFPIYLPSCARGGASYLGGLSNPEVRREHPTPGHHPGLLPDFLVFPMPFPHFSFCPLLFPAYDFPVPWWSDFHTSNQPIH